MEDLVFVRAIEVASGFTRPIHSISRNYGSTMVQPGAATLFFINADGWALTCRHVAVQLAAAEQLANKLQSFRNELATQRGTKKEKHVRKELERKYQYSDLTTIEIRNNFVNCIEGPLNIEVRAHPVLDLALLHFHGFTRLLCTSFPVFPADTSGLKQGKFLCRLGFPFPEFTNFSYDQASDSIIWTNTGKIVTPQFPIEGMITRHLQGEDGQIAGFELSTPGLRGQSGGPAFDVDGKVWGMQAATNHLDLNFDVDQEMIRNGLKKRVRDSAFLHVGLCVHVDIIKSFMQSNNVTFQEG